MMHAEVGMTMKRPKLDSEISAPSRTTPLQQLLDELQALIPTGFTEETSLDLAQ